MHTSTTSTVPLVSWTAAQLLEATQGYWLNDQAPNTEIKRILTDSRDAEAGDAFLALKGERFDAHAFITQVAEQGCQAMCHTPLRNSVPFTIGFSKHPFACCA